MRTIEQLAGKPQGGLIVTTDDFVLTHSKLVNELLIRHGVPSIFGNERHLPNGGLMYYGYVRVDQYRQAAVYVDRILKGAKPGDLPIQAPGSFELKINLKTATALGIEVPMGLMLRANELVE
jgi:putative tryptophan/tyrosine transport system substrate-binding protein